jgi:sorting and assembly machinery component 37
MMPIPQRYYVPNRIRESYRLRLEAAGLWSTETEGSSEGSKLGTALLGKPPRAKDPKEVARDAFALEQVWFMRYLSEYCVFEATPDA